MNGRQIRTGDIFELVTPKGNVYLHYIYKDDVGLEFIRVLFGFFLIRPVNLDELVLSQERYVISFPLSAAYKRKIIEKVGFFSVIGFEKPQFMRAEHNIKGVFLGWYIINTETCKRQLVKELTEDQKKLSPWGIWNDTLLIDRLLRDWSLNDWF